MKSSISQTTCEDVRNDISAYIDGELGPDVEQKLESHFRACGECAGELNSQKSFLHALDVSLEYHGDIPLPSNFTRSIVTNAEARVSGLRRPRERRNALVALAVLVVATIAVLGNDLTVAVSAIAVVFEKSSALIGFISHFIFDIALGAMVVFRSLAAQLVFGSTVSLGSLLLAFAISTIAISRLVLRNSRV